MMGGWIRCWEASNGPTVVVCGEVVLGFKYGLLRGAAFWVGGWERICVGMGRSGRKISSGLTA